MTREELADDALREVANVGSGHAATMLSRLVGGASVMTEVPRVARALTIELLSLLGGANTRVLAAEFSIEGPLLGRWFWVLPERDARRLAAKLTRSSQLSEQLTVQETGALTEAANVVASAFMDGVAKLSRLELWPSTPDLVLGDVSTLVGTAWGDPQDVALAARFHSTDANGFGGQMLWVLPRSAVSMLLKKLGLP